MFKSEFDNQCDDDINREVLDADLTSRPDGASILCSEEFQRSMSLLCAGFSVDQNNWQAGCKSVRERNSVMFSSGLLADIHFLVGKAPGPTRRLAAHKYVLCSGSSVFYAMFYGPMAAEQISNEQDSDIEVPDVEPSAFFNMLRYLYTDCISLEPDTVLSTLYTAKKYLLPGLTTECVRYLQTNLAADNACVLLAQARLYQEEELARRCWEVIDAQAGEALRSDGITQIDRETLELILQRDTLNVSSEVQVFDAVMRWSAAECARRNIDVSAATRREVLGATLFLVHVAALQIEDFANHVVPTGLLTLAETTDIFLFYTAHDKPQVIFPSTPRQGLQPRRCRRFRSSSYRGNQWRYRGRCDAIEFESSRRIFVAGYGLYGSSNGAADYRVRMELRRSSAAGAVLAQCTTTFSSDGSNRAFTVLFGGGAVQIEPHVSYTASVVMEGAELSYFGQEGLEEVHVGETDFKFRTSPESTNGTGIQGGQIPDIIFY